MGRLSRIVATGAALAITTALVGKAIKSLPKIKEEKKKRRYKK